MTEFNKEKNFISAVIYVYNNENEILNFLNKIDHVLSQKFEKHEIICVDDASTDRSIDIIKEFSNNNKDTVLSILKMSFFQGLESSMNAGVDLAIGDFVFEFDTVHMNYKEELVIGVYLQSLKGFDIVNASPISKQKITTKVFYLIFNKYSNNKYCLDSETFRILSRRAINRVHGMSKTIPYRKAIYATCGLMLDVLKYKPINDIKIKYSKEKNESNKQVATDSLILFTDVAYKFALTMTILMMIATFVIACYAMFVFTVGNPIEGWTTTILFLSFSFFGLFGILSIIIKYLSIIVNLIFKKQRYVFKSIDKISNR